MDQKQKHIPVMLNEVIKYLNPQDDKVYVDATFGNGGYTTAILEAANCKVIAIDRDPTVLSRVEQIKEKYGSRFEFVAGRFGNIKDIIEEKVDGFVFDIGVSSMQLDDATRGFSFSKEAPLDMRMSLSGITAADIVNNTEEDELADIIYTYSEEKKSRQIARKIVEYRKQKPIETTTELAEIIYSIIHKNFGQINPATRTFQALRIAVNEELQELKNGLEAATDLLKPEGRLVVVDFHSLEDRIVKKFFNEKSGKTMGVSRYMPQIKTKTDTIFDVVSKAICPTDAECEQNNRARSAKLRYAIKAKGVNND